MGCLCSNNKSSNLVSYEENQVIQYEKKSELINIPASRLISSLSTHTETSFLASQVIPKWLAFHNMSSSQEEALLLLSQSSKYPSLKLLRTYCILLGKGSTGEKSMFLYQTFNEACFIGPSELKLLLGCIAEVSCKLILMRDLQLSDHRFSGYYNDLKQGIDRFVWHFHGEIYDKYTVIYSSDFYQKMHKMNYLLVPKHIRKLLFKFSREKNCPMEIPTLTSISSVQEPPKARCPNEHEMLWSNLVLSIPRLTCSVCQVMLKRAAWHCSVCEFYQCDNCSSHNKLQCLEDHPLVLRFDVSSYYKRIYNSYMVNCELCCESKVEPSWHCRACKYDICLQCALKEGYFPPKPTPICKHTLNNQHGSCFKCSMDTDGLYCNECDYYVCKNCYAFINAPTNDHPDLKCNKSHPLKWFKNDLPCVCCRNTNPESFFCMDCQVSLCPDCAAKLITYFDTPLILRCHDQHLLQWDHALSNYTCNSCFTLVQGVGALRCLDYFLCLNCIQS